MKPSGMLDFAAARIFVMTATWNLAGTLRDCSHSHRHTGTNVTDIPQKSAQVHKSTDGSGPMRRVLKPGSQHHNIERIGFRSGWRWALGLDLDRTGQCRSQTAKKVCQVCGQTLHRRYASYRQEGQDQSVLDQVLPALFFKESSPQPRRACRNALHPGNHGSSRQAGHPSSISQRYRATAVGSAGLETAAIPQWSIFSIARLANPFPSEGVLLGPLPQV